MTRYEVRNFTKGQSRKQFHVFDLWNKRDVFHTDNRERADEIVQRAGIGTMTQHIKDFGHAFVASDRLGRCAQCSRRGPNIVAVPSDGVPA